MSKTYADAVKSQKFGFIADESGNFTFGEKTYDNYNDAKKNFHKFIERFGYADFETDYYASLETGASGIVFLLTDDIDNLKKEIDNNDNSKKYFCSIDLILKYFYEMKKKNKY